MAPSNKSISSHALAALLVVVAAAAILGQAPRGVEAQGLLGNTAANVVLTGVVPCSASTANINPATVPAFPNANVQLVCGSTVVATTTTSSSGAFVINLGTLTNLIANTPAIATSLLGGQCRVVVTTPLAACNIGLPGVAGALTSTVQTVNSAVSITSGLLTLITGLFNFAPTTTN